MSFPWTNLITAAATLIAALGVTSLNARASRARLRHERESHWRDTRTEAYAEFLRAARTNARMLGQTALYFAHGAPDDSKALGIIEKTDDVVDAFNTALARVEIVGTAPAAQAATAVYEAARTLGTRSSAFYLSRGPFDVDAAQAELHILRQATDKFAASCRSELAEHD